MHVHKVANGQAWRHSTFASGLADYPGRFRVPRSFRLADFALGQFVGYPEISQALASTTPIDANALVSFRCLPRGRLHPQELGGPGEDILTWA